MIANEILAVLFTFGVVFHLSDAILGLTILAWGNSIGGMQFMMRTPIGILISS